MVGLQQRVQQLQTERHDFAKMVQEQVQESPLKRGRFLREDFVPHTDEEVAQWMQARQSEMHAAIAAGHTSEVCSGIGGRGCNDFGKLDSQSFQCEQCGPLMSAPRPTRRQCGFLGLRVGDVSNPGPPKGQYNKRHGTVQEIHNVWCLWIMNHSWHVQLHLQIWMQP